MKPGFTDKRIIQMLKEQAAGERAAKVVDVVPRYHQIGGNPHKYVSLACLTGEMQA